MSSTLTILQAGPAMSVQDKGRPGYRAQGLTVAGAMDAMALCEGAALLGQSPDLAAIEMAGSGGTFSTTQDTRIALTGAQMIASIDGTAIAWNASHLLPKDAVLSIGGARQGTYGYLHLGGGIDTPPTMGSRASHLRAGVGQLLAHGDTLPLGHDKGGEVSMTLPRDTRFDGGTVRFVSSMQTEDFSADTRARFTQTTFRRDPRANRMGVRMDFDGDGFATGDALSIVSEVVVPGDIQIAGDGAPFVLMFECQTTGGYPRIGTVIPCDLPRIAQAPAGAAIQFEFVDMQTALHIHRRYTDAIPTLNRQVKPLIRDPASIRDLLGYQLISGAVSAHADPFE